MPVARKKNSGMEACLDKREGSFFSRTVIYTFELLPLLLIFSGVAYGGYYLWLNGVKAVKYKVKPVAVVGNETAYCPEALSEFRRLANLSKGRSLLDPMVIRKVRSEYERSPWVSEVCTVRRVFPDRIMVSFVARRAFAQVKEDGYYWMVDVVGVMLPVEGVRNPHEALPVICGNIGSRPDNGEVWSDAGVTGALRALALMQQSNVGRSLPVEGIKVCREDFLDRLRMPGKSRPRLELITSNGVTILWGPAGDKLPGEIEDTEKMAMLRQLVAECGTNPGLKLDIRTSVPGYSYNRSSEQH